MNKVSEYRNRAQDCRRRADIARDRGERTSLLLMSATWETLSSERLMVLRREKSVPCKL